ncbi:uncharacterized protein si:ch211-269k10.4 [Gambusia affinis]|uniref:uncharacterized protein si:ch211-269k10.4 n=1 Tax=Gambusia affinis TaxID=33528 RepID=UPI001CDD26F1|nr:uncharacterized protein si:ch211-269k10.4 [Gambusia affinis]XP_043973590.1 uncharacterized protein si:ch211-269k10.4 [Gambusia affinis]
MASADVDMDIHEEDTPLQMGRRQPPPPPSQIRYYQASEMVPEEKGQLHNLLQKQPAVLGSLQIMSGTLSVAVGILFAATQEMHQSLFCLFRVSQLTGALFVIAGLVSNLLFKYPALLMVSIAVNCGCIVVAIIGAILISVDLARWNPQNDPFMRIEAMGLCVLGLEVFLSAVLCFWFFKEKKAK